MHPSFVEHALIHNFSKCDATPSMSPEAPFYEASSLCLRVEKLVDKVLLGVADFHDIAPPT
jgi:hypothetical protein